jgi:hypothetical protein
MASRHKDSCTTAQPFERWGDAGGYGTRQSVSRKGDGGPSVQEVAQANPGCNTPRRKGTWMRKLKRIVRFHTAKKNL